MSRRGERRPKAPEREAFIGMQYSVKWRKTKPPATLYYANAVILRLLCFMWWKRHLHFFTLHSSGAREEMCEFEEKCAAKAWTSTTRGWQGVFKVAFLFCWILRGETHFSNINAHDFLNLPDFLYFSHFFSPGGHLKKPGRVHAKVRSCGWQCIFTFTVPWYFCGTFWKKISTSELWFRCGHT